MSKLPTIPVIAKPPSEFIKTGIHCGSFTSASGFKGLGGVTTLKILEWLQYPLETHISLTQRQTCS